ARVDALALDVEELRELPGGDPDRRQVRVVPRDVGQREHQQPLAQDAHLLAAERQRVRLRDRHAAAHARGQRVAAPGALALAAPTLEVEGLDLDRSRLGWWWLGARRVHPDLPEPVRSRQPTRSGNPASTFPLSSPVPGTGGLSSPTFPLRYPSLPPGSPSSPGRVPHPSRPGTSVSPPRYLSPPPWSGLGTSGTRSADALKTES